MSLTLYGVFLRDYYDRFKSLSPDIPILHIPGLDCDDDTLQWIMGRIDGGDHRALREWVNRRYSLHLQCGAERRWAWYVMRPARYGIWLSNEKVARDVFDHYKRVEGSDWYLLFLPVPDRDASIVNDHESIDDLILT